MEMTVKMTSVFPEKKRNIFVLLQRFDTLKYTDKPSAEKKEHIEQGKRCTTLELNPN